MRTNFFRTMICCLNLFFQLFVLFFAGTMAQAKTPTCDIWGYDFAGSLTKTFYDKFHSVKNPITIDPRVVDRKRFNAIWGKYFGGTLSSLSKINKGCFVSNNKVYSFHAIMHRENEGTHIWFREEKSLTACQEKEQDSATEEAVTLPQAVVLPISQSCPALRLGMSKQQVQKLLGPAHVQHDGDLYYVRFRSDLPACVRWLNREGAYSDCCFPGISFWFEKNKFERILIKDGAGEGPDCGK